MTTSTENFFNQNFFILFDLPRQLTIDETVLSSRYRALQQQAHPDRYAGQSALERRLALNMASRINDAYTTLKKPLSRAIYLLSLHGLDVLAETNTTMPIDFLEQQMTWHETIAEANGDEQQLQQLTSTISDERNHLIETVTSALAEEDMEKAGDAVRCWVYLDKLLDELQH